MAATTSFNDSRYASLRMKVVKTVAAPTIVSHRSCFLTKALKLQLGFHFLSSQSCSAMQNASSTEGVGLNCMIQRTSGEIGNGHARRTKATHLNGLCRLAYRQQRAH